MRTKRDRAARGRMYVPRNPTRRRFVEHSFPNLAKRSVKRRVVEQAGRVGVGRCGCDPIAKEGHRDEEADADDLEEDEEPTEGALLRSSSNGIPQTASSRKQATTTAAAAPSSAESAARRLLKKPDPSRHQNAMTYRLLDTGRRGRQSLQLSLMKKLGVS